MASDTEFWLLMWCCSVCCPCDRMFSTESMWQWESKCKFHLLDVLTDVTESGENNRESNNHKLHKEENFVCPFRLSCLLCLVFSWLVYQVNLSNKNQKIF